MNILESESRNIGGLRINGLNKKKSSKLPLISIITVVYNGKNDIEKTIQSVINQTYNNIEYIVIDGGSTDGTLDIIKNYEDKIDYWQSEPDAGIYDAMNKGIKLATGVWINFMNAGDIFYHSNVISNFIANSTDIKNVDVFYGNAVALINEKEKLQIASEKYKDFYKGPLFRHNSAFFNLELHKKNLFQVERKEFGFALDFKLIYDLYENNCIFRKMNFVVVAFDINGISNNIWKNLLYNYRIVREYHFVKSTVYFVYRNIKELLYVLVMNLFKKNT